MNPVVHTLLVGAFPPILLVTILALFRKRYGRSWRIDLAGFVSTVAIWLFIAPPPIGRSAIQVLEHLGHLSQKQVDRPIASSPSKGV